MSDKLDRIEQKLDKVIDTQSDMRVDVAEIRKDININTKDLQENKEDIAEHISRTEALEVRVDILEEPKIVKKYLLKWVIAMGTVAGATYGVIRLIDYFSKVQ